MKFRKARSVLMVITSVLALWVHLKPNFFNEEMLVQTHSEEISVSGKGEWGGLLVLISRKTSVYNLYVYGASRTTVWDVHMRDTDDRGARIARFYEVDDNIYNITYFVPAWESEIITISNIPFVIYSLTVVNALIFVFESFIDERTITLR